MQISNYLSNLLNIQKHWKASWLIFRKGSAAGFRLFCVRTGCPRLPSPQTPSSAGSSAQRSPGRSRVPTLETKTALFDVQGLPRSSWGEARTQYLTFWTLQKAPPQEWCCSCWWNRNRLSVAPPRDGLVSHPYAKRWSSSGIVLFFLSFQKSP